MTHTEDVIVLDDGDSDDSNDSEDEAAEEEADVSEDVGVGNNGQSVHDNLVVKTLRQRAIQIMKDDGVVIEKADEKMALQLFPRVSSLSYCDAANNNN